jgi:glycine/D-amino acid oxidase-like deaminating enzyme
MTRDLQDQNHQYPPSYYAATTVDRQVSRQELTDSIATDVCIVGAGFTGLYTALRLAEAGKRVVILESARIGWGASGRNGGQAILGFSCDMPPLEAQLGYDEAREIWNLMRDSATEIRQHIAQYNIDCDWRDGHLWTSILPRRESILREWQREAAEKWSHDTLRFIPKNELTDWVETDRYCAGLYDPTAGHLHPLKYLLGLAAAAERAGVQIYEQSAAVRYQQYENRVTVETEKGKVTADALILAANVYLGDLDKKLSRRIIPVGSFMVATEPLGERAQSLIPSGVCVTDNQFILDYFRMSADGRLLFGGGCTYLGGTPRDIPKAMRPSLERVFPQLKGIDIEYGWGGMIDCTVRRTPDFGRRGNVLWAQGFSGHGVLPTCVAGRVLAEAVLGEDIHLNRFMKLSNPPFPGGKLFAAPIEAAGKLWYRLRDLF